MFTVSVAVCAVVPLIVTEAGMLHVVGSLAAMGVMVQPKLTVHVNPLDGVMVMVEVFPVVAPGVSVTAVPLTVKLGLTGVALVTTWLTAFDVLPAKFDSPLHTAVIVSVSEETRWLNVLIKEEFGQAACRVSQRPHQPNRSLCAREADLCCRSEIQRKSIIQLSRIEFGFGRVLARCGQTLGRFEFCNPPLKYLLQIFNAR